MKFTRPWLCKPSSCSGDLVFDFRYFSDFSEQGSFDVNEFPLMIINITEMRRNLQAFGGKDATEQQRIEAYLLHIGVTEQEIASIREILLED